MVEILAKLSVLTMINNTECINDKLYKQNKFLEFGLIFPEKMKHLVSRYVSIKNRICNFVRA